MLYLLFQICLSWVCALFLHELGHAWIGRLHGGQNSSINRLCAPPKLVNGSRFKAPFYERGALRIGLYRTVGKGG